MALIDEVFAVCKGLGDEWTEMLKVHGLNIQQPSAQALANELLNQNLNIDRTMPGFQDFADDQARGIVPGRPAHSLLYHALASPNVLSGKDGKALQKFPKLKEIEAVENYVFGVHPPTVDELLARSQSSHLAIVIFAYEYRPAAQTCHRKYADLVFARTGIARVGTRKHRYVPELRGYLPQPQEGGAGFHVCPARYAAFLAAPKIGSRADYIPMRFRDRAPNDTRKHPTPDDQRSFWVPIHKLFPGIECLRDANAGLLKLKLQFDAKHFNEKLFRFHQLLGNNPMAAPPYVLTEGIAKLSASNRGGAVVILPKPHRRLVDEAKLPNGKLLTFTVPNTKSKNETFSLLSTSLQLKGKAFTKGPAYVHIRTEVLATGKSVDLNQGRVMKNDKALRAKLRRGGYEAQNYHDFTGEGWISVACPQLANLTGVDPSPKAAYSLVCGPDFYPSCDQRELTEWTGSSSVPKDLQDQIWSETPDPLCDVRLPPNLQLNGSKNPFEPDENTVTALVPILDTPSGSAVQSSQAALRHSHLPDDAAGLFSPGWDVSTDTNDAKVEHLAGYSLGSPFPEDTKLCAALSTFWPAVAPDATREMEPLTGLNASGTVSPMTDQEIGEVGKLSWDGVAPPQVVTEDGEDFADYANFARVDYVRGALDDKFTINLTARVDSYEYQQRVLALAWTYRALGAQRTGNTKKPVDLKKERPRWKLLSFVPIVPGTPELAQAEHDSRVTMSSDVYRCDLYRPSTDAINSPTDVLRKRIRIKNRFFVFVSPTQRTVLFKRQGSKKKWRKGTVLV
jgi:hypothetical protein